MIKLLCLFIRLLLQDFCFVARVLAPMHEQAWTATGTRASDRGRDDVIHQALEALTVGFEHLA